MNPILTTLQFVSKYFRDSLTERDGVSYCVVRTVGFVAAAVAIIAMGAATWRFWMIATPNFTDFAALFGVFGTTIATICGVIVWKNNGERQ